MSIIFKKGTLYLSERFEWQRIPYLFPAWQAPDVMQIADKWKDRPTGWAVVSSRSVDLDTLEVMKF